jgi:hypothetical protein
MAILNTVTTTITSFTPASAAPGTQVMIQGSGFTPVTEVLFNGVNSAGFTIQSDSTILATVPKLPAGIGTMGPVSVFVPPNDTVSTVPPNVFTFLPSPPAISSFTPTIGEPGTVVEIDGRHFEPVKEVDFNGQPASFIIVSPQEIKATVPQGATTGPIRVSGSGGADKTAANFVIPVISGITPSSGKVGAMVTITGKSLGQAKAVLFGNVAASIISEGGMQIVTKVPVGAQSGPITVQFTGFALKTQVFTVLS